MISCLTILCNMAVCRCRKLLNFRIWPSADGSKSWDQSVRLPLYSACSIRMTYSPLDIFLYFSSRLQYMIRLREITLLRVEGDHFPLGAGVTEGL